MREKVLRIFCLALVFSGTGVAQDPPVPEQNGAEHSAYLEAINTKDPTAKASKLESFLREYHNSVERDSALDWLLVTYQTINNVPKVVSTAKRILQNDPKNFRALGLLTAVCRYQIYLPNDEAEAKFRTECSKYSEDGLEALKTWQKPAAMSDDEYLKAKNDLEALFTSTSALSGINIDPVDRSRLQAAVDVSPNDFSLVYGMALWYVNDRPPNCEKAFWYLARS